MKYAVFAPSDKIRNECSGEGGKRFANPLYLAANGRFARLEGKKTTLTQTVLKWTRGPQKRKQGNYKILLAFMVFTITLFSFCGCSNKGNSSNLADKRDTEDAIEAYITERITPECNRILYDEGDPITVLIVNEKASVTIKAFADFCIPSVAEELVPIILEALTENETELSRISFTYYRMNNSGIVEDSMVDWTTKDGESGTFASKPDGVTKPGYTIADLQEYYKDFDELVGQFRSGEEVSND